MPLVTPSKEHGRGVMRNPVDGAEMVFIPAGTFYYGSKKKKVYLDDYYIYKYEVTNAMFEKFVLSTGYDAGDLWREIIARGVPRKKGIEAYTENVPPANFARNCPVVNISWYDALSYCRWAGVSLPTEAEWEKAAGGKKGFMYPWGNKMDISKINCIENDNIPKSKFLVIFMGRGVVPEEFLNGTSPYGVCQMSGNAAEWCRDLYSENYTPKDKNPLGPTKGNLRVVKGGSWKDKATLCSVYSRKGVYPPLCDEGIGFRCVYEKKKGTVYGNTNGKDENGYPYRLRNPKDGAVMILIPQGYFEMGAKKSNPLTDPSETPKHKVWLSPYYIYKYEVTNEQFHKFVEESGYKPEGEWQVAFNRFSVKHPVTEVSYKDALMYAQWAGGRLPTEAEWEKAARGEDGREYPWGNKWDPNMCNNMEMNVLRKSVARIINYRGLWYGPLPVGSFPLGKSPYGVMDMSGNVAEWCLDWYDEEYYKISPVKNPSGPPSGEEKVLRGGSYLEGKRNLRCASRDGEVPEKWCELYGIRVVLSPENALKNINK